MRKSSQRTESETIAATHKLSPTCSRATSPRRCLNRWPPPDGPRTHVPNAPLHLGECHCINITRAEPITFVTAFVRRSADCAHPSVVIVCSEKKDESEIKWIRIVWVRQRELHSPLRFRMQSCHRVAIDSIILWCKQRRRRVGRVSIHFLLCCESSSRRI